MTHPKSYWISLIVFFLIIAFAIVFAWYAWDTNFEIDNESSFWQALSLKKDKEEQKQIEGTSDWQTYQNEEYGFGIMYPSSFIIFPTTNNNKKIDSFTIVGKDWSLPSTLYIIVNDKKIDKEIENIKKINPILTKVTIGGKTGEKIKLVTNDTPYIIYNVDTIKFKYVQSNGGMDEELVDKILSTFKFID